MSAKDFHPTDVDIDPGWYPGQPELEEEPLVPPPEPLLQSGGGGAAEGHTLARSAGGAGPSGSMPVSVPTVLTKLQKWGDYESVGAQVLPTKFIPMKTPLSVEILDSWSLPSQPKHRLTVPEMVAQQAASGRRVGLLLDLSNHDCLYAADIPPGLAYTHVQLVAKELPPPEFVDAVVGVAKRFWAQHPDDYIAVHCAYGFNRTGFVVCCYLIECCGLSVEDALAAFAESRPPGVKHEQFRMELHRRYGNMASGAGTHGVYGSPDDNSSFGCSPSCGSLDLRDLGGGGSPLPGLTRGSTFDCVLAPHHSAAMAAAAAGGSSPCVYRRSFDGHQTLTFTSTNHRAADYQRGSSGGALRLTHAMAAASHSARSLQTPSSQPQSQQQQQQQQQQHAKPGARPPLGEEQQQQGGRDVRRGHQTTGEEKLQQQQQQAGERKEQRTQANGTCVGQRGAADGQGLGGDAQSSAPASAWVEASAAAADGRTSNSGGAQAAVQQSQPQPQPCCNDNESLGVNDRVILQTLRQQTLAQLSSTIPEESGSAQSTPARGCSSISLAEYDSTAGHSTPRPTMPGRYSHKSLDIIDWGAAAAADEEGPVVGSGAGPPVPAFEALRLG